MAKTIKKPNEIADSIMSCEEKQSMIKLLIGYQRSGIDWDVFFKKVDPDLLSKWKLVVKVCRKNGFINPHIENSKIIWRQILSRRNELNDECTACDGGDRGGDCKGKIKINSKNERVFIPCWSVGFDSFIPPITDKEVPF
jgi:hypothetical protein